MFDPDPRYEIKAVLALLGALLLLSLLTMFPVR